MGNLDDKVAFITDATSGIGEAARKLCAEGCKSSSSSDSLPRLVNLISL